LENIQSSTACDCFNLVFAFFDILGGHLMTTQIRKQLLIAACVVAGLQSVHATRLRAATSDWTQLGAGPFSWNDSANWTPAVIPNAISDVANLITVGGPATQSVTLDAGITVGTLDLTNTATSYTIANGTGGSLTFNNGVSGSTIFLNAGALPQTIDADVTLGAVGLTISQSSTNSFTINGSIDTNGLPLTVSSAGPTAFTNVISGAGSLAKRGGSSTLTLSAPNSYSGATYFGSDGQAGANMGTIALVGGDNRLPITTVLNFHPVNFVTGGTYTATLDIGSTNQTLSTIHLPGADVPNPGIAATGAAATIVGTGTLTLNGGNLYVGISNTVNGYTSGQRHNLNMSGLSNFVFNNSAKEIAVHDSGNRVGTNYLVGTLTLAVNNTIDAANLLVGDTGPSGVAGGGRSDFNFGSGANVINIGSDAVTGRINVGYSTRSTANMTLPAGGTLSIRGFGGGSTPLPEFLVGLLANSNSATAFTDTVNFSAGTVNAAVTKLDVGTADNTAGARGGVNTSNFTLGATSGPEGFTVGNLNIGRMIGAGANLVTNFSVTANFTLNSPNGVLNATTITLAENTITDTSAFTKTLSATLALTDGTIRASTIQLGTQGGTVTALNRVLNWTAGTIENTAGSDLAINDVPIALLTAGVRNFNATGSNSIIQNAGSPISGATFGINKIGAGALILNAANTYTGPTTVSQGTLGGNGTLASVVSLLGGSTISPGTSPGTLTVGGLTISDNSSSIFELNAADTTVGGGINDLIDINGLLDVSGANASTVTVNVLKIGGGNFDGLGTWTLMTYDTLSPGLFNPASVVITGIDPGYMASLSVVPDTVNPLASGKVVLNVVPEASSMVLMGFGLLGFAGFVRNRRAATKR
jgi:autotransporter-associated beta strand protein